MARRWWVQDDEACLVDGWHGKPNASRVLEVLDLPGNDDCVAVLDWMDRPSGVESWHPFDNLVRIRPSGEIVWAAPSPSDLKSWTTGLEVVDGRLFATAWSHRCEVDIATGAVLTQRFVK